MTLGFDRWLALLSLVVAAVALIFAFYAFVRGNKNTSAATFVGISEAFREAWERLYPKLGGDHQDEFADLLNLIEISCAIHLEKSLAGNSRTLMRQYLESVLDIIINNPVLNGEIPSFLQDKHTFIHMKKFLELSVRSRNVVVPPAWLKNIS